LIKVIKTNISIHGTTGEIFDHQSYIEQEESWEAFIAKVHSGHLFPHGKQVAVENIKYDDFHLSCDINKTGWNYTKHFAYIEGRVITK
jgi:hypothetical protein